MPIRPANTVSMIQRRFAQAESEVRVDAMELIGLYDELARLERKWREQIAQKSERRQPGDIEKLNRWFDRLMRLIERTMRGSADDAETKILKSTRKKIDARDRS